MSQDNEVLRVDPLTTSMILDHKIGQSRITLGGKAPVAINNLGVFL